MYELEQKKKNLGIQEEDIETFNKFLETLPEEYKGAYQEMSEAMTIQDGINNIRGEQPGAVAAGEYISSGFSTGILNGKWNVVESMRGVANSAINAAMKAIDAHSPSRVFMKIGGYVSEGLGIGIEDEGEKAVSAIKEVVGDVIGVGENANFSDMFSEFGNMQPNLPEYSAKLDVSSNLNEVDNKLQNLETLLNMQLNVESERDYTFNINNTFELDSDTLARKQSKITKRRLMMSGGVEY